MCSLFLFCIPLFLKSFLPVWWRWHFKRASHFTFRFASCFSHPLHRLLPRHPICRSVPPLAYSLLWSAALVSLSHYGCLDSRGRWRSGLNTGGRKSQRQVWQSHLDSHGEVWRANHNNEEVWSRGGSRGGWESQEKKPVNTNIAVSQYARSSVLAKGHQCPPPAPTQSVPPSLSTDTNKPNNSHAASLHCPGAHTEALLRI